MIAVLLVSIILCLARASSFAQEKSSPPVNEVILLQVDTGEGPTTARFVGLYSNDSLLYRWDNGVLAAISSANPYTLYCKGNKVGYFSVDSIRTEEDYLWIFGTSTYLPEMRTVGPNSFQYWFTAMPKDGSLSLPCTQPFGFGREKFKFDFDCDGQVDSINTRIANGIGEIKLFLATGASQLVDSMSTKGRLDGVFIEDVFDIDSDGIPEILTTHNTYPTYHFVVYKKTAGKWQRWFQRFAGGD
ncbi:MAG: hypothetical protein KIT50_12225 [Bacteroidetes bacterium]|nr:hypothetical protein [Bacteroidota bacterium]